MGLYKWVMECRVQAVTTPTSYSGGSGFNSRPRRVVNFSLDHFIPGKSLWSAFAKSLGGPQRMSKRGGYETNAVRTRNQTPVVYPTVIHFTDSVCLISSLLIIILTFTPRYPRLKFSDRSIACSSSSFHHPKSSRRRLKIIITYQLFPYGVFA
jgi:hypothetical protein